MAKEVDLIIGVGVVKGQQVLACHANVNPEPFREWLADVARAVPAHHRWFAKCWDQVLLSVLAAGDTLYIMAAHECVGRAHVRGLLSQLREELASNLVSGSHVQRVEKKLKAVACSIKGVVPPRKVLVLYEGAPKKFLTKEEQAPEYLEGGLGKARLQSALEAADADEDSFVFSLDPQKRRALSAEEEEGEDAFTFSFPRRPGPGTPGQQKPGLVYTIQVPAGPVSKEQAASKSRSRKFSPSPGKSGDFLWNGARVSPDVGNISAKVQQQAHLLKDAHHPQLPQRQQQHSGRFMNAIHSTIHALGGRRSALFSAQFDHDGHRNDSKYKGAVGDIAPSGLSWEDEIASQLAAAGVKVSASGQAEGDADVEGESEKISPENTRQLSQSRRFPVPKVSRVATGGLGRMPPAAHLVTQQWRANNSVSTRGTAERGLGLGRIAKSLRNSFRATQADGGNGAGNH